MNATNTSPTNRELSLETSNFDARLGWTPRVAFIAILGGTAALCIVDTLAGHSSALSAGHLPERILRGAAILLLLGSIIALARPRSLWGLAPAAYWTIGLVSGLLAIDFSAISMPDFVAPIECAVLAIAVVLATVGAHRSRMVLVFALAGMLAWFGVIHWRYAADISVLIPAWFPGREVMPYVTGGIMILACPALLIPASRTIASMIIAAMFASWLIVVHAPRILAQPDSASEWRFAITGLCLAGAMLLIARRGLTAVTTNQASGEAVE